VNCFDNYSTKRCEIRHLISKYCYQMTFNQSRMKIYEQ